MSDSDWTTDRIAILVAALFGLSALGCATLLSDTDEDVTVNSDPSGATVSVDGTERGETPATINLDSDESHTIRIEKPGYKPRTYHISTDISTKWVIIDVVVGLLPIVVDAITGAWYELDQTHVNVTLQREEGASTENRGRIVLEGASRIRGPLGPMSRFDSVPYQGAGSL